MMINGETSARAIAYVGTVREGREGRGRGGKGVEKEGDKSKGRDWRSCINKRKYLLITPPSPRPRAFLRDAFSAVYIPYPYRTALVASRRARSAAGQTRAPSLSATC